MLARVMTFYSESVGMTDVVESMRSDLPPAYASLPGFRGLLVLERPGARIQVIAVTLWEDEAGVAASEELADTIADRIAAATGTSVSRNIYNVLGRIGIADRKPESTG
jgi:heme-degrading monooxygenase HmoA